MNERINKINERWEALKPYVKIRALEKFSGVNKGTLQNALSKSRFAIAEDKIKAIEEAITVLEEFFLN